MRELSFAVPADVPALCALERECFAAPLPEDRLARQVADPMRVFLCAKEDGVLLGAADFQFVLDEGYIGNVAVTASARRSGIGRALVEALLREAEARKLAFLTLEVRKSNAPARALYETCGFMTVGERKNYYEKPAENAILMTRKFGIRNSEL